MPVETVDLTVAVHFDKPGAASVRVSDDGEDAHGKWIANSLISMKHYNLQHTQGVDRYGYKRRLPIAIIRIPVWLAKKVELV